MKSYQVIRTNISPYQAQDFVQTEKNTLEKLDPITYTNLEMAKAGLDTVLITNTHTKLSEIPSKILEHTKLILHPNSGYDHFDIERDLWESIPLLVGHEIRAQAVAEYSIACLFQGLADLSNHLSWNKNRRWDRKLISETNIWVFGFGHIGKIVARTLKDLGANITVVDPFVKECPFPLLKKWTDGKLKDAHAVIACLSLNKYSQGIFGENFFENVHPELLFINGARGKLVHEEKLKMFLRSNPNAFAFLDVFEQEPFGDEWIGFPQVWKTSHIAGVSKSLDNRIIEFEYSALKSFLELDVQRFKEKYHHELLQNKIVKGVLI